MCMLLIAFNCNGTFIYRFVGHLGYGAAINAHNDSAIRIVAAAAAAAADAALTALSPPSMLTSPFSFCFFVHFNISHFNFIVVFRDCIFGYAHIRVCVCVSPEASFTKCSFVVCL